MGYLGNTSGVNFLDVFTKDVFNGTGSQTAFTLSRDPGDEKAVEVFVNNVRQEPGSGKAYTVSGTTLTFSAAPSSATGNIYVIHVGRPMGTVDISNTAISNKTTITSLADTDKFLVHDATDDLLKSIAKSNMPGGTWTQLATSTASNVSSVVLSGISSSYKRYRIECTSVVPATDATELRMTLSANADGSSPITSAYYWSLGLLYSNNSSNSYSSVNAENDAQFQLNYDQGSASGEALDVTIYTGDLNSSSLYKNVWWDGAGYYTGNNAEGVSAGGHLRNTTSFSSCVFTFSSGNITSGLFRLYGMV